MFKVAAVIRVYPNQSECTLVDFEGLQILQQGDALGADLLHLVVGYLQRSQRRKVTQGILLTKPTKLGRMEVRAIQK